MPEAISDASSQQVEVEDANTGVSQQSLSDDLTDYARCLERALTTYSIQIYPIDPEKAQVGPSVIRFLVDLRGSERLKRVQNIAVELQRELELSTVPFIDNVPATSYVGIDIPRSHPETVQLLPLLQTLPTPALGELPIIIGRTPDGQTIIEDMSDFPHLLVAGATNSGKSVFLRSLLLCLIRSYEPKDVRLLIIDPKRTDFSFFSGLPHVISGNAITDPAEARDRLLELVHTEMLQRQNILAGRSLKVKDFNQRYPAEALPPIVALIDEYAQLISIMNKRERDTFERDLMSLAAVARSTGIHLILATQRPSADVVTGTLTANLDARIAFKVASAVNSRIVIDQNGAENLLGRGDMLFRRPSGEIVRVQAPFVGEEALQEWLQMRQ
jgi:DNA segregation ATPase FtsK/SpoIIIE-like protein